jgi:hypothetical protein
MNCSSSYFAIIHLQFCNFPTRSKHPSNWICTVHITVATFANDTSSDIAERFLTSNREKIIPTLSTMLNRSISSVAVNSFFEPCTVSVLIDATVHGSSYVFEGPQLYRYFSSNKYVHRGWRHSLIILIFFSCYSGYNDISFRLPHRLFYHSLDCGHPNIFPNKAFVPDPLNSLRDIYDPTHSIHYRQLPLPMRLSISTPKYAWDSFNPRAKPEERLASRWDKFIFPLLFQPTCCPALSTFFKFYDSRKNSR